MSLNFKRLLYGCGVLLVVLSACNKNTNDNPDAILASAQLAVYHMVPAVGSINFYLDGTRQNQYKFSYLQSTGYLNVPSGLHTLSVKDTALDVLESTSVNLSPGISYSLLITGSPSAYPVTAILLSDTAAIDQTNIKPKVRFVNASPGAAAFDVYINSSVFKNIPYQAVSKYVRADTGKVGIKVNYAGTGTQLLNYSGTLSSKGVYTLFTYGVISGNRYTGLGLAIITNH